MGEHDVTEDDGEEKMEVCGKVEHPDYDRYTNCRIHSSSISQSHSLVTPMTMTLLS